MLLTCLDYKETDNQLTATADGDNVMDLAENCGITDVTYLKDEECQKDNVVATLQEIAARCNGDDILVFFYSGHGTSVPDKSGDEEDGSDEALCYVDEDGQITYDSCLIDDDFAAAVVDCLHPDTQMLILTDCCHSGTIADLRSDVWGGLQVVAIAGCTDAQEATDTGSGGVLTGSMMYALQDLVEQGALKEATCATLYNSILEWKDENFSDCEQDISISSTPGYEPDGMMWPLCPTDYTAPGNRW